MLLKKPKRKDFTEITGAKPPNNRIFDAIGFGLAERDYYKSTAERAIEALKWYADHMGKSKSMDMRVFVQEAGNKAKQALSEIQASEEE